jgi:crotonobetainyl-CoA:carnitine CoA-transferase CaiB-like acyl-CoA transferase
MAAALEGITILELARVAPGEFCTMILADMGAEVLKIETPPAGGGPVDEDERERAPFSFVNRNKRSLALNLKAPEGQAIFHRLAAEADAIVEGFRPGVMERLGGGYETVSRLNPRLIYCSLSGFGQDGPYRDRAGHDLNYLALGGVLGLIGEPDRAPAIPLNIIADYGGASLHGAVGILLALFARERTGRGQLVDIAYLDTVVSLFAATPHLRHYFRTGQAPGRGEGALGGGYPYYAVFETRDAKFLTVGCLEPRFWENLCRALGREDLIRFAFDPDDFARAASPEARWARAELEAIIRSRTRDEWIAFFVAHDVCVAPVQAVAEAFTDPQVLHRGMVVEREHPRAGKVRQVGTAIKLSGTPGTVRRLAPYRGEHTDEVLRGLGYADAEIAALRRASVVT